MTPFPVPGNQLGRYLLGEQLGHRDRVAVYDATDTALHRPVGLTVVLVGSPVPPDLRHRLSREAATLARGGSGLGLQILDVTEAGPAVCLVTPPVPATTVQSWTGALEAALQRVDAPTEPPTQLPGSPSPLQRHESQQPQQPQQPPAYEPTRISRPPQRPPASPVPPTAPPPGPTAAPWSRSRPVQAPPPGGLYATSTLPLAYAEPPRRRRWPVLVAVAAVLVLVGSLSAWGFFTGRLGFGPLSSKDKAAAAVIAEAVDAPAWADASDVSCASTRLLHHSRSGTLDDHGLIEADDAAAHGWRYTGAWQSDDARAFVQGLLECSDDWTAAIGRQWHLATTDCLADIGTGPVAGVLAQTDLKPRDRGLLHDNQEAAEKLDDCYAADPAAPTGRVRPSYRAVDFVLTKPTAQNGVAELSVGVKATAHGSDTTTYTAGTSMGGERACVDAKTVVTYGWGTTRSSGKQLCGTSKPPRIWWKRQPTCDAAPGCLSYALHVEGFASFTQLKVVNTTTGGFSCGAHCRKTLTTSSDGRGVGNGFYFDFTPHGTITARVGKHSATMRFR